MKDLLSGPTHAHLRLVLAVAISLVGTLQTERASAQTSLLVSGQTQLATIDTDGDGPDPQDCSFGALISGVVGGDPTTATLDISGAQSNMPSLRACLLSFDAFASKGTDSSSNFVTAYIYDAHGPMGFNYPGSLPLIAQLYDEVGNTNIASPVGADDPRDAGEVREESEATGAIGSLCRENGSPAAQARLAGGPNLLIDLDLYPTAVAPTHLKIPGPPAIFELAGGGFQAFDAYVPVTPDGRITVASSDSPMTLLVDINLATLPACGFGRNIGTPTLTSLGLGVLMLCLLGLGTTVLSRRAAFASCRA